MATRKRILIILGATALTLTVALSAFFFGGPRPGSAAPAGIGPAAAPPVAPAFGPALVMPAGGMGGLPAGAANAPGGPVALGDDGFARAAASYFGISADQLRQDLHDRGSLQAVAAKYGKDTADGKAGLPGGGAARAGDRPWRRAGAGRPGGRRLRAGLRPPLRRAVGAGHAGHSARHPGHAARPGHARRGPDELGTDAAHLRPRPQSEGGGSPRVPRRARSVPV